MNNSSETDENVELIWKVAPCLLLVVGTIGNVLSLVVLCRKSMKTSRLKKYLICLSLADLLVLYTGLLPLSIKNIGKVDITNSSSFLCKVLPWMLYFSLDMSAWIMVSATLERSISVWIPHKVRVICTRKRTFIILLSICALLLIVNGHYLIGYDLIVSGKEGVECYTKDNSSYEMFEEKLFPWVDLMLFSIGPFICQIVGNTAIIVGLVRHSRTMSRYSISPRGQGGRIDNTVSSTTTMLLFLNVMFLAFTLPISIYYLEKAVGKDVEERQVFHDIANLLNFVNNSTNFIAYILSSRRFRLELWSMIRTRRLQQTTTMIPLSESLSTSENPGSSVRLSSSRNLGPSRNSVFSVSGQVS